VIRRPGDLPKPERLLMKLVTGCDQCDASGKTRTGGRCSHCDGRGTVWVVVRASGFSE
jgi:DnaJ-class molecular chaperone